MANSFLIVPELQEMLNKLELFYKSANTHYARNLYTDAKASIRSLIAIERGKDE